MTGRPMVKKVSTAIHWFRNDLRLETNPAFAQATRDHDRVATVVVADEDLLDRVGPFRRAMWLGNVSSLSEDLASAGGSLTVVTGDPRVQIPALAKEFDAEAVYVNAATSRFGQNRDRAIERANVSIVSHWGTLISRPGSVLTKKGTLSKVFTAFYKTWLATPLPALPDPGNAELIGRADAELSTSDWFPDRATLPAGSGTDAAYEALTTWLARVDDYVDTQNLPATEGTSLLSPHLRFGTISPRAVLDIVGTGSPGRAAFARQLAWRDWYGHLLLEFPDMAHRAVRTAYDKIEWNDDPEGLSAWQQGLTGYPIVDAGMRQLAQTGWMHNRVRMITGSFLVKDLLIDWREGERWFRHLLIDADPPQNAGNWQWVAGTGTDAAPYFRVFNPVTQSQNFDPDGEYISRWVPELGGLDAKKIHAPWLVPPLELAAAGVILGDTYPAPIVDHAEARDRALDAYKEALTVAD